MNLLKRLLKRCYGEMALAASLLTAVLATA